MSNTGETTKRERVGPEDEAREDQMDDNGLELTDEDEDETGSLDVEDAHGVETSNSLKTP